MTTENPLNLEGKTAIVTGASRGIGKAIAETLLDQGARVLISSRESSKKEASDLCTEWTTKRREVYWTGGDISQQDTGPLLVKEAVERFGRLDILINNAGITADNIFMRMSFKEWDDVLKTNLYGAMFTTQAAIREMRKGGGSIVFISSVSAHGNPGQANYCASKAGLEGFMKTVALEYAGRNIRANAIECGPVETDMLKKLTDKQRETLIGYIPMGRTITTQEIANTVLFLASDASSGITGQVINVDGGMIR